MSRGADGSAARSGFAWLATSQILRQGIQFVAMAVLARLLAPDDFGLMGLALVFVGFVSLFKDLGLGAAVIQRDEPSARFLGTMFWMTVGVGVVLAALMFVTAPSVSRLFGDPQLEPMLRVLAAIFVIAGVGVIPQALLERSLRFAGVGLIELSATIIGAAFGIAAALTGLGVWSLVLQTVAVASAGAILSLIVARWVPPLVFERRELIGTIRFSAALTGFSVFNYAARNADNALVGRYLGTEQLGFYAVAYRIMLYPLQAISTALGRVMYPIYSRLQDDDARVRRHYIQVARAIAFLGFPMVFGIMAMPERTIGVLLGSQWLPASGTLAILAPVGLIQIIVTTIGPLYQAKGRTDLLLYWGVFSGVITVGAFIVGLRWGIEGVATAYLIVTVALAVPAVWVPYRLVGLRLRDVAIAVAPSFICGLVMLASVALPARAVNTPPTDVGTYVLLVALGAAVYVLASFSLNRREAAEMLRLARL